MLYPENYSYLSDVLSYIAIGARSVENQQHRLTSSGVDVPVGMKNPTGGDLGVMLNAVYAAQHGHDFIYRTMEVTTDGNPLAHTILRGAVSKHGQCIPNYHYEDLELLLQLYGERELVNPACIVDANHSNSNKRYEEQVRIVKEVLHSRRYSPDIHKFVKGVRSKAIWSREARRSASTFTENPSPTRAWAGRSPSGALRHCRRDLETGRAPSSPASDARWAGRRFFVPGTRAAVCGYFIMSL